MTVTEGLGKAASQVRHGRLYAPTARAMLPVTDKSTAHLRLHVEEVPGQPALALPQLAPLCRAFEQATGWQRRCEQSPAGLGEAWSMAIGGGQLAGRLVLAEPSRDETDALELAQARPLALAIGGLLGEINRLRCELWQREAELAAGVPVAARPDEEPHLAERLESVLKGGVEAVGCKAAGLYLLDEGTSELKLRAAFGLPHERLLAPARPLRGAVADLEALVGHAVVLEDTALLPHWRCPEDYPSAVCVPVSSPTIPLGTLWAFSEQQRDFSPQETNLLEIIAGRLAADLEREMLLAAGAQAKSRSQKLDAAMHWLADRLPTVAPLVDDYEVAGWTRPADEIGSGFHDWSVLPDGRLALAVGAAEGRLLAGAMGAASLHAAVKSHAGYRHSAAELLSRVNDTLWTASPGDQHAALAYALLDPDSGRLELALAGGVGAILVSAEHHRILGADGLPLGSQPELVLEKADAMLAPGEFLLLASAGVRCALDAAGLRIGENAIASLVSKHLRDSADDLAARLRKLLAGGEPAADLSIVIVKRRLS